jgi:hypothetical protein
MRFSASRFGQQLEHLRLHVGGEHLARRSHAIRQPHGHVPRAGADVRTGRACGDLENADREIGFFLLESLGTLQPRRALISHHRREAPPLIGCVPVAARQVRRQQRTRARRDGTNAPVDSRLGMRLEYQRMTDTLTSIPTLEKFDARSAPAHRAGVLARRGGRRGSAASGAAHRAAEEIPPKTVVSLDVDRKARHLATLGSVPDSTAARALIVYHLAEQRPMMGAFLDALGIAHENGLIQAETSSLTPTSLALPSRSSISSFRPRTCASI